MAITWRPTFIKYRYISSKRVVLCKQEMVQIVVTIMLCASDECPFLTFLRETRIQNQISINIFWKFICSLQTVRDYPVENPWLDTHLYSNGTNEKLIVWTGIHTWDHTKMSHVRNTRSIFSLPGMWRLMSVSWFVFIRNLKWPGFFCQ